MVKVVNVTLPSSKRNLKAPYSMVPKGYTIHNTYNDATAANEIKYMHSNNNATSYHVAIDDVQAVQGVPFDRNTWHAGDGKNGYGNRNHISVEICYSKSGGGKYDKAEDNAINYLAKGLHSRGWGVDKVKKHQDWSGKNCPHRILARTRGWALFLEEVQKELNRLKGTEGSKPVTPSVSNNTPTPTVPSTDSKSIDQLAQEVIDGKHGTGDTRKRILGSQYNAVQKRVNELLSGKATVAKPTTDINKLANEVINGKYGSGEARKKALGKDYSAVQKRVNEILQGNKSKPKVKTDQQLAEEVIRGVHGSGRDRMKSLGSRYDAVQKIVNQMIR